MGADEAGLGERVERYLLGRLRGADLDRFEASLFQDERVFEVVCDVEEDLIERYLAQALSPSDVQDFERHFAVSKERRERIEFRRALAAARPASSDGATSRRERRSWATWPAWLGVAATLTLGVGLLIRRAPPDWPGGAQPSASPGSVRRSPAPRASAAPTSTAPRLPALVLRAGLTRGGGRVPRLHLPVGSTAVRIQAALSAVAQGAGLSAVLRTVEGDHVWRGEATLLAGARQVEVDVPASLLHAGDYVLSIVASTGAAVDEYAFRVPAPEK